jgi:acetylglutamate kinase
VVNEPVRGQTARDAAPAHALVIKLGGRAFERPDAFPEFAAALRECARRVVLVHGGGAEVSAWSGKLGLPAQFLDGLRVTDPPTLEVATAVLAGLSNKRLVAALRARGVDAVGLAALDGGIASVAPHTDAARLGEVGEVRGIETRWLAELIGSGRVPVLASIGADGTRLLNLNADDLAAALAGALGASLLLLSDVEGVSLGGRVVPELAAGSIEPALAGGEISGGMAAKLRAAARALALGAHDAAIARWSGREHFDALLAGRAAGTRIVPGSASPSAEEVHHA